MAAKAKKDFTTNPAFKFLGDREEQPQDAPPATPKPSTPRKETKSIRKNLLFPPSLDRMVRAGARERGLSVNDFVCQTLFEALGKE